MDIKIGTVLCDVSFGDLKVIVGENPRSAHYDYLDYSWDDLFMEYSPPKGPFKMSHVVAESHKVRIFKLPVAGDKVVTGQGQNGKVVGKIRWFETARNWGVFVELDSGVEVLRYIGEIVFPESKQPVVVSENKVCTCPYDNFRWGGIGCTCGAVKRRT